MSRPRRAAHRAALAAGLFAAALVQPSTIGAQEAHAEHAHQAASGATAPEPSLAPARPDSAQTPAPAPAMVPMGSGTSWVPLSSGVRAAHMSAGRWMLMMHGVAYAQYAHQDGPRGGWQFGSINWLMVSAAHPAGGGRIEFRAMGSAEPWTLGDVGYPMLLQTGETYQGIPLHDRQHPHDLAMELSMTYERKLVGPLSASLYLAPVGEPAAGPVAFMHRPSGMADPFAPLSHHWQDGSHVTFGVVTAGLFTRHVKLEGSLFNGREPDEVRTNFDYRGRRLDSWAARLTLMPHRDLALSGWYAYFESPESLLPDDWGKHVGASLLHSRPFGGSSAWSSAVIWGAKRHEPGFRHPTTRFTHSVTAETSLELGRRNTLFARGEYVQKDMEELFLPHEREQVHEIRAVSAGYVVDVVRARPAAIGLGVRGSMNFIPEPLAVFYGGRRPLGAAVFARLGFERGGSDGATPSGHGEHAGH